MILPQERLPKAAQGACARGGGGGENFVVSAFVHHRVSRIGLTNIFPEGFPLVRNNQATRKEEKYKRQPPPGFGITSYISAEKKNEY